MIDGWIFESVRLEVSGHTDNRGNHAYNIDLSRRRAESVKHYLVDAGVDESRITTVGYGPDQPRADNKSKKGRAENRRIEFKILDDGSGVSGRAGKPIETED